MSSTPTHIVTLTFGRTLTLLLADFSIPIFLKLLPWLLLVLYPTPTIFPISPVSLFIALANFQDRTSIPAHVPTSSLKHAFTLPLPCLYTPLLLTLLPLLLPKFLPHFCSSSYPSSHPYAYPTFLTLLPILLFTHLHPLLLKALPRLSLKTPCLLLLPLPPMLSLTLSAFVSFSIFFFFCCLCRWSR